VIRQKDLAMSKKPARLRLRAMLLGLGLATAVAAQQGDGTDVSLQSSVWKPAKVPADAARIAQLQVPPGFSVNVFARDLGNVRVLAVAPGGNVYLSRREQGDVLLLKDANRDGVADGAPRWAAHVPGTHGLAIRGNKLYIVTVKEIFVADMRPDGSLGVPRLLVGDLPDGGQHPNRTIAFGPDHMLWISVGSTCNACNETNPENATILRASPDGKSRVIWASGLRNTIGFDWHPVTGELWGLDHGIDFLGDDVQPEELNRIVRAKRYGWPHVYGDGGITPWTTPTGDITKEQWRALSEPMALGYTAHAAPMQFVFYPGGSFPAEYTGDAFATMRGSWNRKPASGYEIVRVRFAGGAPQSIEPFITGFLTDGGTTHFARPVGLEVAGDGSLLMADDANGVIYRIAYTGGNGSTQVLKAPATAMLEQARQGVGVPIAIQRSETAAPSRLTVRSGSIEPNGRIARRHSEYYDGKSPRLSWSAVRGAKSYAVIMEDPDAKPITPFVHWVAWNIPARLTHLPEGLQEHERLLDPEGMLQGRTSRGSPGYYGPRPPVGDPPHHYHFQVFALDTVLDVPPGAERDAVLAAMAGHVLAAGELVGEYQQLQAPLK
jgi:Raf kinase inhibitor-like YbhB/YbcL family protein